MNKLVKDRYWLPNLLNATSVGRMGNFSPTPISIGSNLCRKPFEMKATEVVWESQIQNSGVILFRYQKLNMTILIEIEVMMAIVKSLTVIAVVMITRLLKK